MSDEPSRPGLDTLADYLEGLLSAQESREVERWIAEDAATATLLRELEELPSLLSADPVEPMPGDVVDRVDAALAEAARAHAARPDAPVHGAARLDAGRHGADDPRGPDPAGAVVVPLRRRRWVAPALAAAAMVGAVAIGAQVVSTVGSGQSDSAGSAEQDVAEEAAGGAGGAADNQADSPDTSEKPRDLGAPTDGAMALPAMRTETFATDVADAFEVVGTSSWRLATDERADLATEGLAYSILAATCPAKVEAGQVYRIRLDGKPAVLVLRRIPGEPGQREGLAYPARCPGDGESKAVPLARAVITLP